MAGTGDNHGDIRAEIREFLTTRRARISPKQASWAATTDDFEQPPSTGDSEQAGSVEMPD